MWKNIKVFFILLVHLAIGGIFGFFIYRIFPEGVTFNRLEFILSAMITFASMFSGFIITAVTVLIGYVKTPIMRAINNAVAKIELKIRCCENIFSGWILIALCVVIGECTPANTISRFWISVGAGTLTYYLVSLVMTGYYLISLISVSTKPEGNEESKPYVPPHGFNIKAEDD